MSMIGVRPSTGLVVPENEVSRVVVPPEAESAPATIADRVRQVKPEVYAITPERERQLELWRADSVRVRRPTVEPKATGLGGGRLLFHARFMQYVQMHRVCWITGRLGGGKTLLSVAMAEELLRMGDINGVITNFPCVLPQALGRDTGDLYGRGIIFDEAWTVLDARDSLINPRDYGGYARKLHSFWLFPSIHMIDKRLRSVICWRAAQVGGLWVYRWLVDVEHKYAGGNPEGWFVLWQPSYYFSHYDTAYIPFGDEGILNRYKATIYDVTHGRGIVDTEGIKAYLGDLEVLERLGVSTDGESW